MDGEAIAINGKASRGSKDRKLEKSLLHMVSAWACTNRLVPVQEATAEKSNEITAYLSSQGKIYGMRAGRLKQYLELKAQRI